MRYFSKKRLKLSLIPEIKLPHRPFQRLCHWDHTFQGESMRCWPLRGGGHSCRSSSRPPPAPPGAAQLGQCVSSKPPNRLVFFWPTSVLPSQREREPPPHPPTTLCSEPYCTNANPQQSAVRLTLTFTSCTGLFQGRDYERDLYTPGEEVDGGGN